MAIAIRQHRERLWSRTWAEYELALELERQTWTEYERVRDALSSRVALF